MAGNSAATSYRFSIIPAGAVTDRSLEPRDLQVLCLLGRHIDRAGWCVRSQVKMAGELGCGRSSVQRSLERLYAAGWVELKQRGPGALADPEEPGRPSASHAYRVRLDRDDFIWPINNIEPADSHAENASEGTDCPPVGTPPDKPSEPVENASDVPTQGGHPGAHPSAGTGAQPYVGTNNDPLEPTPIELERRARARDRTAKFKKAFEAKWPTAAVDDRNRVAYAAEALSESEQDAALAGIEPFLENLERLGRKTTPAGWRYLEQKSWTLLEGPAIEAAVGGCFPEDSAEARAIATAYAVAGKTSFLQQVMKSRHGAGIYYRGSMTPQFLALANPPPKADWPKLTRQQAAAWNEFLKKVVTVEVWTRLIEGSIAPWLWPPKKDGTLSAAAPDLGCSETELADFTR